MSNIPISSLPIALVVQNSDEVPIVQGGTTKRATAAQIASLASTGTGSNASFVVATDSHLTFPGSRLLAGQSGVVTITDGGAGSTLTVGIGTVPVTKLSYTAPGTGGVAITQQSYNQRVLWAADYGAVGDGVTDDSVAFQNLINEAIALAVPARFIGQCKASFTITGAVDFGGAGIGNSVLIPKNAGTDGITISTALPVSLHDFEISYNPYGGSSAGVSNIVVSSLTQNGSSSFYNLLLDFAYYGFNTVRAAQWTLRDSFITNSEGYCVYVRNTNNVDSGDGTIDNVICIPGGTAAAAIHQESASGLRIINSKINGSSLPAGYELVLPNAENLADLIITGNSFEGITGSAVKMTRAGTTGGMGTVAITGNELSGLNCISIPTDVNGAWIFNITSTGNVCILTNSASAVAFNIDSATAVNISGNSVQSFNAGSKLYAIGSAVTHAGIGVNTTMGTFAASTFASGACDINLDGLKSGATGNIPYYSGSGQLSSRTVADTQSALSQGVLIFKLSAANFNSTADQPIAITLPTGCTRYRVQAILVDNPSTSLTTAAGGFYTAASKGGTQVVSSATTYSVLTTNTAGANGSMTSLTLVNTSTAFYNSATLFLSLTTPQGGAATADVSILINPLP